MKYNHNLNPIFLALFLGFIFLTYCQSCKKDPPAVDTYPAVTQTGANVWAVKLNGTPIIYRGTGTFGNASGVLSMIYEHGTNITLHGSRNDDYEHKDNQTLYFNHDTPQIERKYFFNKDTCAFEYDNYFLNYNHELFKSFYESGYIIFHRIDATAISGEFEVIAVNDINDTLKFTEGRFDIHR